MWSESGKRRGLYPRFCARMHLDMNSAMQNFCIYPWVRGRQINVKCLQEQRHRDAEVSLEPQGRTLRPAKHPRIGAFLKTRFLGPVYIVKTTRN